MQVDLEYLRRHYHSLSDEGLLEINRADLVEAAQRLYDAEVTSRGIGPAAAAERRRPVKKARVEVEDAEPEQESGEKPEWYEDASEVFSEVELPGRDTAGSAATVIGVLDAAGIPAYLDLVEEDSGDEAAPRHRRWRVLVPGEMNLHATSVIERDVFNDEFELQWKAHLQNLSDEQLGAMNPEDVFCGLFDRVERILRTYEQETARRGILPE